MPLLTEKELSFFNKLINLNQIEMLKVMSSFLKKRYKDVRVSDKYIYAVGDIPIALVAHLDTVSDTYEGETFKYGGKDYPKPRKNATLYYDQWKEVIASNENAGFDDRAGVYAIIKLINAGLRPSVILTTDEEIGGIGAKKFVSDFKEPLSELNYIIQLDRRGVNDCVFYDLNHPEFEKYIESYGFRTNIGSFSDISTICPAWKVAGVNLSIGYEEEHTEKEILIVGAWLATIEKVKTMLTTVDDVQWIYIKRSYVDSLYKYSYYNYGPGYDDDYWGDYYEEEAYSGGVKHCKHCDLEFDIFDMQPLMNDDGKIDYYCFDCLGHLEECANCGTFFYQKKKGHKYCDTCAKEMKKFWKKKK